MEMSMYCNYSKCHKVLETIAWVTSCSHIFCDEHGMTLTSHSEDLRCPACSTNIEYNVDIVRVKLNPSEADKSMVLAGLNPHTILDITIRAINFWSFQVSQEYSRLQMVNNHNREQAKIFKINNEIQTAKMKDQNSEINALKKLVEELRIEVAEKNRSIQKLHLEIDSEKKKTIIALNKNDQRNLFNDEPRRLSQGLNLHNQCKISDEIEDPEFVNRFVRNVHNERKPIVQEVGGRKYRRNSRPDKYSGSDDYWRYQ